MVGLRDTRHKDTSTSVVFGDASRRVSERILERSEKYQLMTPCYIGHGGAMAAEYARDHLASNISSQA